MLDRNWSITELHFNPDKIHHSETIYTIGNGFLGTRGTSEEVYPGESRSTFVHGVFDDVPIVFTELANFPDWTGLEITLGGEPFSLANGEILSYSKSLNLKNALLSRVVRWKSPQGRISWLHFERFASLADEHQTAVRVTIQPENYTGKIEIQTGINGSADNLGLKHWVFRSQSVQNNYAMLELETRQTKITAVLGFNLHVTTPNPYKIEGWNVREQPTLYVHSDLEKGQTMLVEKFFTIFTSRESANPLQEVKARLENLPDDCWNQCWQPHQTAWEKEWENCDVFIEGDDEAQLAIRFNLFQLLIAAPRKDDTVNIGAKTLSGYGYRGHAFWDTEIFMLPLFIYTRPEIARNLLSYRYHNLAGAREKARANGYQGAQFPWESAATGEEVTPTWVPHFKDRTKQIRIWTGDIEIHISADIAYSIWLYWRITGDDEFLFSRGAEIILETARFWASRAEWDEKSQQYHFSDVIGPDEYHDHVNDNAYTNYLAKWNLSNAISLSAWLAEHNPSLVKSLFAKLNLSESDLVRWQYVADKIFCPYEPQSKLVEQFAGYFNRKEVNLEALEPREISVQALLGIEGANETQILKQPDVLMLMYLLPDLFTHSDIVANYDYYTPRTDHTYGSSLGPSIQAIMACWMGYQEQAYEHFMRAARADLHDVRGNAEDGIHGASAGGLWQAVVFGFAGVKMTENGIETHPRLPRHWKKVAFKLQYKGKVFPIEIAAQE